MELLDAEEMGSDTPLPYIWKVYRLWKRWGISPVELLKWPSALVDSMLVCEVVDHKRKPIPLMDGASTS
jgi:hypothetical protein